MKITVLAIVPNPGTDFSENLPVTHQALAATAARFSRSNAGIAEIHSRLDWDNLEKSTKSIFDMADYGHASIRGLSGHIPVALEGISMRLAYELFHIAQQADGQESSTRYIDLSESPTDQIPDIFPEDFYDSIAGEAVQDFYAYAFEMYEFALEFYRTQLKQNSELIQYPPNASEKTKIRLRKNYAFDRARYYLPFATKTNIILNMTAGAWGTCLSYIDSFDLPEFKAVAAAVRNKLQKIVPDMLKHSYATPEQQALLREQYNIDFLESIYADIVSNYFRTPQRSRVTVRDGSYLAELIDPDTVEFIQRNRNNRYDLHHPWIKQAPFTFSLDDITLAELRDLNRHRTGYRRSSMRHVGFYVPPELATPAHFEFMDAYESMFLHFLNISPKYYSPQYAPYMYCLGSQTDFTHTLQLDKLIYEIELRTGPGAHYRYAEHMRGIYSELIKLHPFLADVIQLGTAEPE